MNEALNLKKRKYTRFKSEGLNFATLTHDSKGISIGGILYTESYGGFSMVIVEPDGIHISEQWKAQINQMGPYDVEVVWKKEIEESITKIGFKYLMDEKK